MDYDAIKLALTLINMIATAIVGLFVLQNRRQQVTSAAIDRLEEQHKHDMEAIEQRVQKRLEDKALRLNRLEERVAELPNKRDIVRIHERLDNLQRVFNDDLKRLTKDNNDNFQSLTLSLGELIGATRNTGQKQ